MGDTEHAPCHGFVDDGARFDGSASNSFRISTYLCFNISSLNTPLTRVALIISGKR